MKKLSHRLNNASIFFRLSMLIIAVFIWIFALFLITSHNYRIEKESYIYDTVYQNNQQTISTIENYVNDISNLTKKPLTYKPITSVYMNYLQEFTANGTISYAFQELNEQIFNEVFTYKESVHSCFIFNHQGVSDYMATEAIYRPFVPTDEPWFTDAINSFGRHVIVDTYELPNIVKKKSGPSYVFGVARAIVQLQDASIVGIFLVNTDVSYFADICNNMKLTDNHRIIILHDDHTIYDTFSENIATTAGDILLSIPDNTNNAMFSLTLDDEPMLASSVYSDSTDWRVISLIPKSELFHEINQIQMRNIFIMIVVMAVALALLFFVTREIVNPINRLSKIMKIAESGDFNTRIQVNRTDEVGMLAISYNSLLDKINELIQEVYLQRIASSELEFQVLQSQINPHFLYNTLESISMMAIINDDDSTAEMAASLGSILRYSISNINQLVTLKDEIVQMEKYISLQEQRFRSQFTISINIDQMYHIIRIPKLILQPIVENAIYHGMSSVRSGGQITISAEKPDDSTLVLIVTDNGVGMSEQKVQDLNGYVNEENELFKSIGMRNVNRRIQLFCGPGYGLTIQSSPNEGTTVYIRIRIDTT